MKKLNKKSKIILLFSSLVLVAEIAVVSMYATGVLPEQSKGKDIFPMGAGCHNPSCACHVPDSLGMACGKCSTCFY